MVEDASIGLRRYRLRPQDLLEHLLVVGRMDDRRRVAVGYGDAAELIDRVANRGRVVKRLGGLGFEEGLEMKSVDTFHVGSIVSVHHYCPHLEAESPVQLVDQPAAVVCQSVFPCFQYRCRVCDLTAPSDVVSIPWCRAPPPDF